MQIKVCLRRPGQPQGPPLRPLTEPEVVEHLWTGERAIARRLLVAALPELSAGPMLTALASAQTDEEQSAALAITDGENPDMVQLVELINQPVASGQVIAASLRNAVPLASSMAAFRAPEIVSVATHPMCHKRPAASNGSTTCCCFLQDARIKLAAVADHLRSADMRSGGGHTAAADLVYLYAATQQWFFAERRYKAFDSEPVRLNHADLFLDRTGTRKRQSQLRTELDGNAPDDGTDTTGIQATALRGEADSAGSGDDMDNSGVAALRGTTARTERLHQIAAPLQAAQPGGPAVRKKYSQQYIWGQLNGWFKQTVYDPAATLSAERRGTLSLPDIESAYGSAAARFDMRVRSSAVYCLSLHLNVVNRQTPHKSWSQLHYTMGVCQH